MKITTEIDLGRQEIEINLSPEDISLILSSEGSADYLVCQFNRMFTFLKSIPDEKISEIKEGVKDIIVKFLNEQANRISKL